MDMRRLEDQFDAARPTPKWTESDREAPREVVRRGVLWARRLERNYHLTLEELERHDLTASQAFEDEVEPEESAWMTVPLPPGETGSKWWRFWR